MLRALAAVAVVVSHTDKRFIGGAAGVDLFFVISGFIMGTVAPGRNAGEFIESRFRRIYPPYVVASLPILFLVPVGGLSPAKVLTDVTLWPLWGSFNRPSLGPGWTLSFECLFYASIALALWAKEWRIPAMVYALCFTLALITAPGLFAYVGSPFFLEFLAGLVIVRLPKSEILGVAALVIGISLFLWSPLPVQLSDPLGVFVAHTALGRVAKWGPAAALVVYGAVSCERRFAYSLWRPFVFLGDASYAIYLWHPVVNETMQLWWPFQAYLMVVLGCVAFLLVERPLLRWVRSRSRVAVAIRA